MQPTPLQAETDAPDRSFSLIDFSLENSLPPTNLVEEQDLIDFNFDDFVNFTSDYNNEQPPSASHEEPSNRSISHLTLPFEQGSGWDDFDHIPRLDPQSLSTDRTAPLSAIGPDAHGTETPATASFPMLPLQPPHSHTSGFIAGYLACLEDQGSIAESLLSTNHLPMNPTGPVHNNWCNTHSENSPVQIAVPVRSWGPGEFHARDQHGFPQFSDSLSSFKKPQKLRTPPKALTKINTSMGASQFSTIPPTLLTPRQLANNNPIQFIHTSISTGPDGRTVLPRTSSKRSIDSGTQISVKRKIIRKKGAACGLCGEQKIKCNTLAPVRPCDACLNRVSFNLSLAVRICFQYNARAWEIRGSLENPQGRSRAWEARLWMSFPAINPHKIKVCLRPVKLQGQLRRPSHYVELELEQVPSYFASDVAAAIQNPVSLDDEISSALGIFGTGYGGTSLNAIASHLSEYCYMLYKPPDDILWPYTNIDIYLSGCEQKHGACRISTKSFRDLITNFDDWAKNDFFLRLWYPPQTHADSFDRFLLEYLTMHRSSTLARIVELTLEAAAYARHLGQERPVSADGCSFYSLPRPVYIQLYALAYHRFHATECALLHELDRLVFWKKDNRSWRVDSSCSDPLILALCIRRMALHYRALMVRYKCFGSARRSTYEKWREMYDVMIRHYRHVFRGTLSPFDEDWKNERHRELLKNDRSLIRMFEALKLEEIKHCENDLDPEDDGVYLSLFVNQQNRKGKSMLRTKKTCN